jgi:hypothetical protein
LSGKGVEERKMRGKKKYWGREKKMEQDRAKQIRI